VPDEFWEIPSDAPPGERQQNDKQMRMAPAAATVSYAPVVLSSK